MKQNVIFTIAMIAFLLLAAPAEANMQSFTNPSEWAAATNGIVTVDFNDVPVAMPVGFSDYSVTGLQIHDVDFTANPNNEGGLVIYSQSSAYQYRNSYAGNFLVGNTWDTKTFTANLPENVNAVAMLVLTETAGGQVIFNFPGYTYTFNTTSDTTPDFIGFVFDEPLTSVTIDAPVKTYVGIDDFAYGTITETPEAGSVWLAGFGLVTLVAARRLRRFSRT